MASPHPRIQLDSKLGAAFLGNLIAAIFYGITCVQTYLYFRNSSKDRQWFRMMILSLWLLDTLHLAFVTHGLYFYLVSSFGNLLALLTPPWSLIAQIYLTCISDFIIRCIFGRRVWMMARRSKVLAACIAMTTFLTFVTGFAFASRAFAVKTYANFPKISYFLYTALGSAVVADLLIAGSLCFALSKSRTGFSRTDSLVNLLMMYAINTSLLTTVCSGACFITYTIWPNEFTFIAIYFSLSKLYLNSLLATLNSRGTLSEKLTAVSEIGMSNMSTTNYFSKVSPTRSGQSVVVSVNREVLVDDFQLGNSDKLPGHHDIP